MPEAPTQAEAGPRAPSATRRLLLVCLLLLAISLPARLVNLGAPPLDRHDFRQTQTAITVWTFLKGGPSVLHYQTPVLGPPWEVPFELPLFQLSAFAVARASGLPLDLACRLTALLWFYSSAWALFALVRSRGGLRLATASLAVYLLTPFTLVWSRAVLIDFAAVALSLGGLHLGLTWLATRRLWPAAFALLLGALAGMTKLTTLVGVLAAGAVLGFDDLRRAVRSGPLPGRLRAAAFSAALAAIPLGAGVVWTRWADRIKAAQPATAWLTSERLWAWNFGTLAQRASWEPWGEILGRIGEALLPGALVLAVPLALASIRHGSRERRTLVAGALVGTLVPILVFFNLYAVHDYYLIAAAPFLAILGGAGVLHGVSLLDAAGGRRWIGPVLLVIVLSSIPSWGYARAAYEVSSEAPIARLGRLIALTTRPDQWVAVQGDQWSSRILYSARRRGFMIWDGHTDVTPLAGRPEFGALACKECTPALLSLFPRRELVGREADFDLYRLW
ncbi:MAG TPA: hypothetical protein VMT11_17365 [Myxococcaceae bacterium]|nr:hypothetical protein [Myxococcaceae bacterium]